MKLLPLTTSVIEKLSCDGYNYLVNRDYRYDALFYSSKKIITLEAVQDAECGQCIPLVSDEVNYYLENTETKYYVMIAS